jgi:hypothetical protein
VLFTVFDHSHRQEIVYLQIKKLVVFVTWRRGRVMFAFEGEAAMARHLSNVAF